MGVPRDHHVTQMVLLHVKMCPPKLTNSRLGCQNNHSGKPESKPADLQGGRRQGRSLKIILILIITIIRIRILIIIIIMIILIIIIINTK